MRRASPTTAARIANYAAVPPALRTKHWLFGDTGGVRRRRFLSCLCRRFADLRRRACRDDRCGEGADLQHPQRGQQAAPRQRRFRRRAPDGRKRPRDAAARHLRDCIESRSEGRHRQGRFGDRHAENGRRQVRPYVWGLASFGEAGVDRVLQILDDEFITIMRQVGALDINHITRRCVTSA